MIITRFLIFVCLMCYMKLEQLFSQCALCHDDNCLLEMYVNLCEIVSDNYEFSIQQHE